MSDECQFLKDPATRVAQSDECEQKLDQSVSYTEDSIQHQGLALGLVGRNNQSAD